MKQAENSNAFVIEIRSHFIKKIKHDWDEKYSSLAPYCPDSLDKFPGKSRLIELIKKDFEDSKTDKVPSKSTISNYLTIPDEQLAIQINMQEILVEYMGYTYASFQSMLEIEALLNQYNLQNQIGILTTGGDVFRSQLYAMLLNFYQNQKTTDEIRIDAIGIKHAKLRSAINVYLHKPKKNVKARIIMYAVNSYALIERSYFESKSENTMNQRAISKKSEWKEVENQGLDLVLRFTMSPLLSYVRIEDYILVIPYTMHTGDERAALLLKRGSIFFKTYEDYFEKAFNLENPFILEEDWISYIENRKG